MNMIAIIMPYNINKYKGADATDGTCLYVGDLKSNSTANTCTMFSKE